MISPLDMAHYSGIVLSGLRNTMEHISVHNTETRSHSWFCTL